MAGLTKNQELVLNVLSQAEAPLSAYSILDELREEGFRAPLQVYRALDKLVDLGEVHRLESLNAFVACSHPRCSSHETVAFTICEECGDVTEVADDMLVKHLTGLAQAQQFSLKRSTIELRGLCQNCS